MLKRLFLAVALLGWVVSPVAAADTHPAATDTHAATGEAAHGAAADHATGHEKPELLPDPTSGATWFQALWVVIIFLALLAILYPTAWKNVLAGLKQREARIRQDIAEAEAARKRAEGTLTAYNQQLATAEGQVRDILAKAQQDAEKIGTTMKMQAQQEAEEIKERATRDIEAARKAALSDIYAQAADLSTNIASKILRRNLNADDQRDLVDSSLRQFETVENK